MLPTSTYLNWKIAPFLKHMVRVSKKEMYIGKYIACDEQYIRFQGKHKNTQQMTLKKVGD